MVNKKTSHSNMNKNPDTVVESSPESVIVCLHKTILELKSKNIKLENKVLHSEQMVLRAQNKTLKEEQKRLELEVKLKKYEIAADEESGLNLEDFKNK